MLQSFEPVLRDLQMARNAVPTSGNMTLNNVTQQVFQLRSLLCGEPMQAATTASQAADSALRAASGGGDSSSSSSSSSGSSGSSSESSKCEYGTSSLEMQ